LDARPSTFSFSRASGVRWKLLVKQRVKVAERRMVEVAVANIIVGMVCVVYVQSVKKWCMVSKRGGQYYAVKELP
jgi:hypothetical protein